MPDRPPPRLVATTTLALACLAASATPSVVTPARAGASAARAAPAGYAALTLDGTAVTRLRAAGVSVASTHGAGRRGATVTFPVGRAGVGAGATLGGVGRLAFRAGGRSASLLGLRVTASATQLALTGSLGGRRTTLAVGAPGPGRLRLDAATGAVALRTTSLTLTAEAARALQRALRLERTPAGRLGTLRITVPGGGVAAPSAGPGVSPASPTVPPAAAGGPPAAARPADAVDVTGATIVWHVRDSLIQYTGAGEGTTASGGATADPPSSGCTSAGGVNDAPLRYRFRFPFAGGWHQPSTGRTGLRFTGTVNLAYRAHGIDLDMQDPELDLDGVASRAVFRFSGRDGTALADVRAPLLALTPAATLAPRCSADPGPLGLDAPDGVLNADGSRTFTQERMPGAVTREATDAVFAGYGYLPGDPFGWITVTYTIAAPAR